MPKLSKNVMGALGIGIVTLVYLYVALQLDLGSLNSPGEGFVPVVFGSMLLILCILLILSELSFARKKVEEVDMWEEDAGESGGLKKPLITILVLVIYPIALVKLGFILSTIPLLYVALRLMEYRTWLKSLLVAIIATLFCYFVFSGWLSVYFPTGILG